MTTLVADIKETRSIPTLPGALPIVGLLPQLQRDPLRVFERATLYAPITHMPLMTEDSVVLGDGRLVQHVLVNNAKNYTKDTRGYESLKLVLGNGLLTSEGSFWKRQRRIAQPAFHRERMATFGLIMTRAANEMVDRWKLDEPFDFAHEMGRVTLRVVTESLLSSNVSEKSEEVAEALSELLAFVMRRTNNPFMTPMWVPTPTNRSFQNKVATLNKIVETIIDERRKSGVPQNDLLSMLMETRDAETGESMTDAQLRDEVMTIMLAGHETTANLLSWTMVMLGQYPATAREVVSRTKAVLGDGMPSTEHLAQLPYTANVIKEVLRLYPPAWIFARRALEDDVVDGYQIKKNQLVFMSPYGLHRMPQVWSNPLGFDPDRWNVDDGRRKEGAYVPFSTGQRKCIGDAFALTEAHLILTTILQRVHLSLTPGQRFDADPVLTLRPKEGVFVIAHKPLSF